MDYVQSLSTEQVTLLSHLVTAAWSLLASDKTFDEIANILRQIAELPSQQPRIGVETHFFGNVWEGKAYNGLHAYAGSPC